MPSQEERLASFNAYSFEGDSRWKEYFGNLMIPPGRDEAAVLRRYQQKYYKRHIDPDFEVDAPQASAPPPPRPAPPPEEAQPRPRPAPPRPAAGAAPPRQRMDSDTLLFLANGIVLVMGVLAVFPFSPPKLAQRGFRWCFLASLFANFYAIRHRYGLPRAFTLEAGKTWLSTVLSGSEFLNLLSVLVFLPSSRTIPLAVVPQACGSVFAVAQHLRRNFSQAQLYRAYFEQPCMWLETNRAMLLGVGASTEISLGFLLIFYLLSPQRSIFQAFLHWQLLKVKYHAPATMRDHRLAWTSLGQKVEPFITQYAPFLATPLGYAKRWFASAR